MSRDRDREISALADAIDRKLLRERERANPRRGLLNGRRSRGRTHALAFMVLGLPPLERLAAKWTDDGQEARLG